MYAFLFSYADFVEPKIFGVLSGCIVELLPDRCNKGQNVYNKIDAIILRSKIM